MGAATTDDDGARVVRALWAALEERDWVGVEALLDPDLVVEWPQSGERFDRAGYLRVNRDYPGDWHITVREVLARGPRVVSEVEIALDGRLDRAVSWFDVRGGRISAAREFWPDPMPIPPWRAGLGLE